jgi:hypothetical protein
MRKGLVTLEALMLNTNLIVNVSVLSSFCFIYCIYFLFALHVTLFYSTIFSLRLSIFRLELFSN